MIFITFQVALIFHKLLIKQEWQIWLNNCLHHLSKVGPDHPCFCSQNRPLTIIWHCTCHVKYTIYIDLNHLNQGGRTRLELFSFLFCFNTKSKSHSIIHPCHVGSIPTQFICNLNKKKKGTLQSAKFLYPAVKPLYDASKSLDWRLTFPALNGHQSHLLANKNSKATAF